MNEAPNTHKQNVTRRPSRESVRALATTAAAPHVSHVCCVLCCMCVCCVVLLSPLCVATALFLVRGVPCKLIHRGAPVGFRVPGYPILPENPTNTRGFWGHARILPGIGLVFWFSIDGSQPYSTQHTHSAAAPPPGHRISHITHITPEWICVLRPPRRPEGAGNNAASCGQTLRYIVIYRLRYISMYRQNPQPIDR